jgi:hypothetical protein
MTVTTRRWAGYWSSLKHWPGERLDKNVLVRNSKEQVDVTPVVD